MLSLDCNLFDVLREGIVEFETEQILFRSFSFFSSVWGYQTSNLKHIIATHSITARVVEVQDNQSAPQVQLVCANMKSTRPLVRVTVIVHGSHIHLLCVEMRMLIPANQWCLIYMPASKIFQKNTTTKDRIKLLLKSV